MNFVALFREARTVYGVCPCCLEYFQLTEAVLFSRSRPRQTPFDHLAEERTRLERAITRFDMREAEVREAARERGRRAARRRLGRLAPFFMTHRITPLDVKVLFDPVDYVAFCGLSTDRCGSITLIDEPPLSRREEVLQASLDTAISRGRIEWQTYRITPGGTVTAEALSTRRRRP